MEAVLLGRKAFIESKDTKEIARLAKIRKEQNRNGLDVRHEYLFAKLAAATQLETTAVEEFVVGDEQFDVVGTFFDVNGPKTLTFFFQPLSKVGEVL